MIFWCFLVWMTLWLLRTVLSLEQGLTV